MGTTHRAAPSERSTSAEPVAGPGAPAGGPAPAASAAPPAATRERPAPAGGVPAALALLGLLTVADLWSEYHLGFGLRNPAALAGVLAAFGAAAGVVRKLRAQALDAAAERATAAARVVLRPAVLVGLAVALALVMATVSSVTVVGDGVPEPVSLVVAPLDDPSAASHGRVRPGAALARMPIVVSPFGRTVRVEAAGYVPAVFTVRPLVGLTVRLGEELRWSPSVLLRLGAAATGALGDGAVLRVWREAGGRRDTLAADSGQAGSAFLLGRARAIGVEAVADWERELKAAHAPDAAVAELVRSWKTPRALRLDRPLAPGDHLVAEVAYPGGGRVAVADLTLPATDLVDVALLDLNP
ncbi:MAG TPA: hypothetical protein VFQ38_11680 [Longimicrobiales bacterium]|nr:hypothetical protein [Longimicrobiales bacterium]